MRQTRFPEEPWATSSPETQGVDGAKLKQALRYLEGVAGHDGVREVVIIKNGYLIHQGDAAARRHSVHSITKVFTSTALGLLIDRGVVTLETKAADLYPPLQAHYPDVTLRHLTTMTSGYRAVGDLPRPDGYAHGTSWTFTEPHPEPLFAPGHAFAYWDSALNLFGYLLTLAAGESLYDLVQREVGDVLGLRPETWTWGNYGRCSVQESREEQEVWLCSGSGNYDQGVHLSALNLARVGLLYLNGGRWNGKQLLSETFCTLATTNQVSADLDPAPKDAFADGRGVYGFGWWIGGTLPNCERKWRGAPPETFCASGYNNNDMFVLPHERLVVVRTGLDQCDTTLTDAQYGRFLQLLCDALER